MSAGDKPKTEKMNTGVVIGLGGALVVGAAVLCVALISAFGNNAKEDDVTLYSLTSGVVSSYSETTKGDIGEFFSNTDEVNSEPASAQNNQVYANDNVVTTQTSTQSITKNEVIENYEQLSKNGDNKLSDHHENKFIKMISQKYNVDTELLVAIYSEPDTGNNFVLQFNGEKNSDGNVIKSPDTLEKVYQIDKEGNVKIATGRADGNVGVSYAEGMFCFNMIKTIVMEQYPDYFTGIKK